MSYQKFVCDDHICSERGHRKKIWYRRNYSRATTPSAVSRRRCPACGGKMDCVRIQKSRPKGGRELGATLTERSMPGRSVRGAVRTMRAKQAEDRERQIHIARRIGDEPDPDPYGLAENDLTDFDYSLPPAFNPALRLTSSPERRAVRGTFPSVTQHTKAVGPIQIGPDAFRMLHSTNQNAVMGRFLLGGSQALSAWEHSSRPRYTDDRFKSSEWCHLLADCLGGATTPDNLVAASFAANTEMMIIEHTLKGKTHLRVRVQAFCDTEHVAERIEYRVLCTLGHAWDREIDGRNDHFTRDDQNELRDDLKDWLTSHLHDSTAGQGTGRFT